MPVITLPPSLREEFSPGVCDGLLELVKMVRDDQREDVLTMVKDNFGRQVAESESRLQVEIAESESRLRVEIAESESRLRVEIAERGSRLRGEIGEVESRLRKEIAESESRLRKEIVESESRLRNEIAQLRADFSEKLATEVGQLRADFSEKLANVKTSLLAWMFVFWIGQAATVVGMMALLLKR